MFLCKGKRVGEGSGKGTDQTSEVVNRSSHKSKAVKSGVRGMLGHLQKLKTRHFLLYSHSCVIIEYICPIN